MQFLCRGILHKVFCLASCVGSEAGIDFIVYIVLYSALVQLTKLSKTLLLLLLLFNAGLFYLFRLKDECKVG
jgi:hypothetical protein